MVTRHGHIGIGLRYLVERIRERGNGRGIVTKDGRPLSDTAAIAWLEAQMALGKMVSSDCPTPQPDGSCPSHDGPAAALEARSALLGG